MTPRLMVKATEVAPHRAPGERLMPSLNCELHAGCVACIVGPKLMRSQYLRLLGGVDAPGHGCLELLGKDMAEMDAEQWRVQRQRVGFVTRTAPLLSVLNGFRNVMLPALYHRQGEVAEIEAKARRLTDAIDYGADHDVLPAYMTYMQRQHLAIARALILEPEILFVDDPFNGLELEERNLICGYLQSIGREGGRSLVIASNDMAYVRDYASDIIFLARDQVTIFPGWSAFIDSRHSAVQTFLQAVRDAYAVFED